MTGLEVYKKLATIQHKFIHGKLDRTKLARALRSLAHDAETEIPAKSPTAKPGVVPKGAWEEIFEYWRQVMQKPRAKPTSERCKKVLARLDDGYTVAQIKSAIDNISKSDFHKDGNHRDLTLICRNGSMLEKWIEDGGENGDAMNRALKGGSDGTYEDKIRNLE